MTIVRRVRLALSLLALLLAANWRRWSASLPCSGSVAPCADGGSSSRYPQMT